MSNVDSQKHNPEVLLLVYEDIANIYQTIVRNKTTSHWNCMSVPLVLVWPSLTP